MSNKKTLKLLSYATALIGCVALAFAVLANWLRRFGAATAQNQESAWYVTVLMGE